MIAMKDLRSKEASTEVKCSACDGTYPAGGWRMQPSARRDDLKRIEFFRKVPFEPTPVSPRGISLSLGLVDHIDFAGQGEGTIENHAAARAGLGRQRAGSRTA